MKRLIFVGIALSTMMAIGCGRYTRAQVTSYCLSHPTDKNCLLYCEAHPAECQPFMGGASGTGGVIGTGGIVGTGGVIETGGTVGTGGAVGTGGTTTPPPYVPVCPAISGYSIDGIGCAGPYVTESFTLAAGQFVKEEGNPQVYAIVRNVAGSSNPLVRIAVNPDIPLSWSVSGCNPDCMAISPPSPNGCSIVRQLAAGSLEFAAEIATTPIGYRAASVILVYQGADYTMTPSASSSWVVHGGDMFVMDPYSLVSTTWRALHLVSQATAVTIYPNVTEGVKRTLTTSDLAIYGKTQQADITTSYVSAATCAAGADTVFDFAHAYPSPAP